MSDTWSTSRLSSWPSEPAYYIIDCQIYGNWCTEYVGERAVLAVP